MWMMAAKACPTRGPLRHGLRGCYCSEVCSRRGIMFYLDDMVHRTVLPTWWRLKM
jgi:hypothetical protein